MSSITQWDFIIADNQLLIHHKLLFGSLAQEAADRMADAKSVYMDIQWVGDMSILSENA